MRAHNGVGRRIILGLSPKDGYTNVLFAELLSPPFEGGNTYIGKEPG
jgi:hypothetical protein